MNIDRDSTLTNAVAGIFIVLATMIGIGIIYSPGLAADLYLDSTKLNRLLDFYHSSEPMSISGIGFNGEISRIIPQLSFYLNILFSGGLDPFQLRITNLLIHLVNGGMVFCLAQRILSRTDCTHCTRVATVVAVIWLISPINLSSVMYVIQRMNQLAALFSLIACYAYMVVRDEWLDRSDQKRQRIMLWSIVFVVAMVLALLSKENAVLVPGYLLLLEFFFYQSLRPYLTRYKWWVLVGGLILITAAIITINLADRLDYSYRSFTLIERLFTQARIVWHYVAELCFPVGIATGVYRDGYTVSTSLASPPTTMYAVIGWGAVLYGLFVGIQRNWLPPVLFGVMFFICGHLIESTLLPLELYFEHRNYLPSFGFYFALVFLAWKVLCRYQRSVVLLVLVGYIIYVAGVSYNKAYTWSDRKMVFRSALQQNLSPRAVSGLAGVLARDGRHMEAIILLEQVISRFPEQALAMKLQILHAACLGNLPLKVDFYDDLKQPLTGKESLLELSQALSYVVEAVTATNCIMKDVARLNLALEAVKRDVALSGRDDWIVEYYIVTLLLSEQPQLAAERLLRAYDLGETRAGAYLRNLIDNRTDIVVAEEVLIRLPAAVN